MEVVPTYLFTSAASRLWVGDDMALDSSAMGTGEYTEV